MKDDLGKTFAKYDMDMAVELPITDEVSAHLKPDERSVLVALAEA